MPIGHVYILLGQVPVYKSFAWFLNRLFGFLLLSFELSSLGAPLDFPVHGGAPFLVLRTEGGSIIYFHLSCLSCNFSCWSQVAPTLTATPATTLFGCWGKDY